MSEPKDNKTKIMENVMLYIVTMHRMNDLIAQEKLKQTTNKQNITSMINIEPIKQDNTEHYIVRTYELTSINAEHLQQLITPNDIIVIDKDNSTISVITFKHTIYKYSITVQIKDKEIVLT